MTEAADDLGGLTRTITESVCTAEHQRELDGFDERFDRALWGKLIEADILSTAAPESLGGGGFGVLEQVAVLVALGRQLAAVPYLESVLLGAGALAKFGSESLQREWATPAVNGEKILAVALDGREVRDKRRVCAHRMIAQIRREVSSAVVERRLGRWIFYQVAGDQVMKIVVAENSQRRRKIFLERVEQTVEIHVRVNIDASFRRQALVPDHDTVESVRAQRALSREPFGDAARRGDQPVEQAFQFF